MTRDVLIVGASVAGIGAANELRRCGFAGGITLIDAQPHLPYDKPPLSKAALSAAGADQHFRFHDEEYYTLSSLELRLGVLVACLDANAREVTLVTGERLRGDAIVIATGARARHFPKADSVGTVHLVRDFDDAVRLRALLTPGKLLAIIGGGFIGAEVASSAAALGLNVTVIEAEAMPFQRLLGAEVAGRLAALHQANNVALRCGAGVRRIAVASGGRQVLTLSDDQAIEADIVVAGLGSMPNVEWLAGSGLEIEGGVVCDAQGRTSLPGIFAAGDVAAWIDPASGLPERHEHWTAAREQARIVAQAITHQPGTLWSDFVPYFWSDMHGKRIQMLGTARNAATVSVVFEDPAKGAFLAEYSRDSKLIGIVGCNAGARTIRYMPRLMPPR